MKLVLVAVFAFLALSEVRSGYVLSRDEQDWGFVNIREGGHIFWWLYFTTASVQNYTDRPLIIWLQGGPGSSSTGYGNFAELGPLDINLKERNYTWVKDVNVLFVDNPVGTGFSYVENSSQLRSTNREIAIDFLEFMRGFYEAHSEFIPVPLYILSESYGGKYAIEIALVLDEAIKQQTIDSNFIGVGLGDAWIAPKTIASEYESYALAIGAIDTASFETNYNKIFDDVRKYIDIYNILDPHAKGTIESTRLLEEGKNIATIMKGVEKKLGIEMSYWTQHNSKVYNALSEDIQKTVTHIVEEVLSTTNIKVAVYNGQLDFIVCTPGVVAWIDKLNWSGSDSWVHAPRLPIDVHGIYEGFEKTVGNLALYWVNRAGHMVPADNPAAMDYILRKLTQDYDGTVKRK